MAHGFGRPTPEASGRPERVVCGIAGFIGNFPPDLLGEMNKCLAHRGPDDSGEYFDPETHLGLTHRRLSIIDVSARGHQPMWDATDTVCIVFNGEIFNFRELRGQLEADGYAFRSRSDTETVLNLYLKYGDQALERLNGMFAFALWDTRDGSLLVVRDGVGVKPLYYSETPHGLIFASELKALLHCPSVERRLDYRAIHDYLTYLWCPAPRTMLQDVKKLEPGAAMRVTDGRVTSRWNFYVLPFHQPVSAMPVAEASRLVREQIQLSVDRQMMSDVPIGALLSGGLDSSSVVACAARSGHSLDCFTIGFRDESYHLEGNVDDLPYAERVARRLGVSLHTICVGPEMAEEFQRMIYSLDEPQADFAAINTFFICRLARERGIKVLLSGAGGDDIFSGYRRHRALLSERYWSWLPMFARKGLRRLSSWLPVSPTIARRVGRAFSYADLDGDERIASYFHWTQPAVLEPLYSEALLEQLRDYPFSAPLMQSLQRIPSHVPKLNRMLYLDCRHFLPDHNLNYFDKMSMATGVEVRVPLLDPDLVSLAARLPVAYKQRGGVGKRIFKTAMEPLLPREVIYRPKSGFGVPVRHWLRSELRPMVDCTLSEASVKRRGIFDPAAVRRLLDLDRSGAVDAAHTLLSLVCIEIWCRMFLDVRIPRSP